MTWKNQLPPIYQIYKTWPREVEETKTDFTLYTFSNINSMVLLDGVNFKPAKCPQQNMDELALVLNQLADCWISHIVLMCSYIISCKYGSY